MTRPPPIALFALLGLVTISHPAEAGFRAAFMGKLRSFKQKVSDGVYGNRNFKDWLNSDTRLQQKYNASQGEKGQRQTKQGLKIQTVGYSLMLAGLLVPPLGLVGIGLQAPGIYK